LAWLLLALAAAQAGTGQGQDPRDMAPTVRNFSPIHPPSAGPLGDRSVPLTGPLGDRSGPEQRALPLVLGAPQAGEKTAPDPPCFVIPSAEELGGSDEIIKYREQFRPQLYQPEASFWPKLDLAVLVALLVGGGAMVWRRVHFRWFWIPAAVTLAYFGMLRGGCICPVGSVANLSIGLVHPERVAKMTAVMFFLPLIAAIIMGRVFCVAGCPLGAVQHLLGGRHSIRLPKALERVGRWLPVLALGATAWLAVRGGCLLVCLLDPYKTAFFFSFGWLHRFLAWAQGSLAEPGLFWVGDLTAWGILIGAVGLGWWVYRPFCRFVCPYGVLLGWFSMVAIKRRKIEQSHCVQCGICEKRCPVHAIVRDPKTAEFRISHFHCIQCNRCSSHCRKQGIC
jgi:ferredoxin-type protein NapH